MTPSTPTPEQIFILLGTDDQAQWHHRVLAAHELPVAHAWWQHQLGSPPALGIPLSALEVGMSNLAHASDVMGELPLWGGWLLDEQQVRLLAVAASSEQDAEQAVLAQCAPGERLVCLVDPSPWIALLAHCRAVVAGHHPPDEDLRSWSPRGA